MVGIGEECHHAAAAIFRSEATVCSGYIPSYTGSANEWLPCRKDIEPIKIKDLNFDRVDSAVIHSQVKRNNLVAIPKKKVSPLAKSKKTPLPLIDFP